MIKSCVTISLVPQARGGPFVFWDDLPDGCRRAQALGFDAVEVFNPTTIGRPGHPRALAFAAEYGLPVIGNSDAHVAEQIGVGWTSFPGRGPEDLRAAILAGRTAWHGSFHGHASMVATFGRQLRKYGRDARDEVRGRVRRDGTGRHLGYPGGDRRPARYDAGQDPRHGGDPDVERR